jgi:alpha-1,6-mannosyltransferase
MAAPSTSGLGRGALATLVAGCLVVVAMGAVAGSPVATPLPAGVGPPAWSSHLARWLGLDHLPFGAMVALTLVVLLVLAAAFLATVREALAGRIGLRAAAVAAAACIAIAAAGPVLLSRDVHSYAAYGRLAAVHGANPYVQTPASRPEDPFAPVVSGEWRDSRSVYGPVFTSLSALVAGATRGSPRATLAGFKAMAGIAVAGATWLAASAARRRDAAWTVPAIIFVGMNPVIVINTVGGGHNDALVCLGLAAAAFVVARWTPRLAAPGPLDASDRSGASDGRPAADVGSALGWRGRAVTALLVLAALVKVAAAIPLALFVLASVMLCHTPRQRLRTALDHAAVVGVIAVAFTAPYGWSAARALADLASRRGWASGARLLQRGLEALGGPSALLRAIVALAFAAALALVLWSLVRGPSVVDVAGRWGIGLLAGALAGPYLLPWYAVWFAPLLALIRDRAIMWIGIATCVVLSLTGIPAEPGTHPEWYRSAQLAVHYVAAPITVALLGLLVARSLRSLRAERTPVPVSAAEASP